MQQKSQTTQPLKKTLIFLDNKYKIEIIYYLGLKTMRFGEIKKNMQEITQQLLTKQLKEMNKHNLIKRKQFTGFPRKVEYSLTNVGISSQPIIQLMLRWEKDNSRKINYILKKQPLNSIYDYY